MKAALLTGLQKVEVRHVAPPQPERDMDVLLRVLAVGICGSDLLYYRNGRIGEEFVSYPFIIGHECVAEVVEARGGQRSLLPGSRVAVDPAVSCGRCDQCRAGRPHTCRSLRFLGSPGQLSGCLCELIVMPRGNCHPFSQDLSPDLAVLAEPFSIGLYAAGWMKTLMAGEEPNSAAVLGSGPIGLATAMAAREAGIKRIYMTDRVPARVEAAKGVADWSDNPERSDIVSGILEKEPLGVDAVFECSGDQAAFDQAASLLRPGGRLLVIGIPEGECLAMAAHTFRRKEITIQHIRRQNRCLPAALRFIREHKADLAFMVTHRFSLDETAQALALVSGYRDGVVKAIIQP